MTYKTSTTSLITLLNVLLALAAPLAQAASKTWDGGGGADQSWHNPLNWNDDTLPGPDDDVIIDVSATNVMVRHVSGNTTVRSVQCQEGFILAGGSFTVTEGNSAFNGPARLNVNAFLKVIGSNTVVSVPGVTNLDGASLDVSGGAHLVIPGVTHVQKVDCGNVFWDVSGAGSVLELPALVQFAGNNCNWHYVRALSGGQIFLTNVVGITNGAVQVRADGSNSLVNLTSLTQVGGPAGNMDFYAQNGGQVLIPQLTDAPTLRMYLQNGGRMPVSQFRRLSRFDANWGAWNLPELTQLSADGYLQIFGSNTVVSAPGVTNLDGASLDVSGGAHLVIPGVTHVQKVDCGNVFWDVSGAGSVLELPALVQFAGNNCNWHYVRALSGGQIFLTNVVGITNGAVQVRADGSNSLVNLTSLTQVGGPAGNMDFYAQNGGQVLIPQLTDAPTLRMYLQNGGRMPVSQFRRLSRFDANWGAWNLPELTQLSADGYLQIFGSNTVVSAPGVTNVDGASLDVSGGAHLVIPGVTHVQKVDCGNVFWDVSGAGSVLELPALVQFAGNNCNWHYVRALSGGQIFLTNVVGITNGAVQVRADGSNSLVNLTSLTQVGGPAGNMDFYAQNGGQVLIPQLTDAPTLRMYLQNGGRMPVSQFRRLSRFDANWGAWNLPELTQLSADGYLQIFGSNTVVSAPGVTNVDGASLDVSGGAHLVIPGVTHVQKVNCGNVFWDVSGAGSVLELPALVQFAGNNCNWHYVRALSGGQIFLTNVVGITNGAVQVRADGSNSLVNLTSLTQVGGPAGNMDFYAQNGGQVLIPQLTDAPTLRMYLQNGGRMPVSQFRRLSRFDANWGAWNLPELTQLSADGYLQIFGSNTVVSAPGVTNVDGASLDVSGGAHLVIPGVTHVQKVNCGNVFWDVSGAGSVLELPALVQFAGNNCNWHYVRALSGGQIFLTNVVGITNGAVQVRADGSDSRITLSALQQTPPNLISFEIVEQNSGAVLLPPPVDFVVPSLLLPAAALAGTLAPVSWTIRNQGIHAAARGRADAVYLSPDAVFGNGNDRLLGHFNLGLLGAGQSQTVTNMVIIPPGLNGSYYFIVQADSLFQHYEGTGETNNVLVSSNAVPVSAPDLTLTSIGFTNASAKFGDTVQVTWVTRNSGAVLANGVWRDRVFLSTGGGLNAQSILLAGEPPLRGPLAAGDSYTNTAAVTLPLNAGLAPATYFLVAQADVGNALGEADEANNTASRSLPLNYPDLPDLGAASVNSPATAAVGQPMSVTWNITNGSTVTAFGPWIGSMYLVGNEATNLTTAGIQSLLTSAATIGTFTITNELAANGSLRRTQTVTVPLTGPAGATRVLVQVDSFNEVVEENETNNFAFATNVTTVPAALSWQLPVTEAAENGGGVTALLLRNGGLSNAVVVMLTSSDTSELTVPASVTMDAGEGSAPVPLTLVADHVPDGHQTVMLQAAAAGYATAVNTFRVLDVDDPTLLVVITNRTLVEGQSATGRVERSYVTADPLVVELASSHPTQLAVTNTVIIPANQKSATFSILAVDDTQVEPARSFSILASAPGQIGDGESVLVLDNDAPMLTLSLANASVSENAGPLATAATLRRALATDRAVTVELSNPAPTLVVLPPSVTIPADQTSAGFTIGVLNNTAIDGTRLVRLEAFATDHLRGERIGAPATHTLTVLDDDSPGLAVAMARKLVLEGLNPATTAAISRNTLATNQVVVTLTSSDTSEATVPASVTLSNGVMSVAVPVASVADGVTDGSQTVTIMASASGLASGSDTLVVTDENIPDLVVAAVTIPANGLSEELFDVSYRVENHGRADATNAITQRVFLSTDPYIGNDTLLFQDTVNGGVTAGQFFTRVQSARLPLKPGDYWVIVIADASGVVSEVDEDNNARVSAAPIHVAPAYSAVVQTDVIVTNALAPIPLYGHATKTGGGPAPQALVNIHLEVRGIRRVIAAFTDNGGNFNTLFHPLPGEAGHYALFATHPGVETNAVQDEFTILGMKLLPEHLSVRVVESQFVAGSVLVSNLSEVSLTGLTASIVSVPSNLLVNAMVGSGPTNLAGFSGVPLSYSLTATSAVPARGVVMIRVISTEGVTSDLPITVTVEPLQPRLVALPASLTAGVLRGGSATVELEIVNEGTLASGPMNVILPSGLNWLHVATPNPLPGLAPGETNHVSLQLAPDASVALGPYSGSIVVAGGPVGVAVPFDFRVFSSAVGWLKVTSMDEYTLYAEGEPPVTNATVFLREAVSGSLVASNLTGADGMLLLSNVTESYYNLEVRAEGHSTHRSTILVLGGVTNEVRAFLARETVRYLWTVTPTEIEDRTRLTVEATFETFVPAPVVTIDPPVLDLENYLSGGQINVTIANHGLIAAEEMRLSYPEHPCWDIKPMVENIGTLPAMSSLTIPVFVQRKSASGCTPCEFVAGASWAAYAANLTNHYFTPQYVIHAGHECDVPVAPLPIVLENLGVGGGFVDVPGFTPPVITVTEPECCAVRVKLRIDQEAVITRDAFNAMLELENASETPLTGVRVEVEIRTLSGEPAANRFGIRAPGLSGIGAVDGSGVVSPHSTGKASWILIPNSDAAPTPNAADYLVSGTLSYEQGGLRVTIPLSPTTIHVLPNAALQVKYFLQRDVFSDDPFTDEIEASEPFSLGVQIKNAGFGAARNVRITSAKPEIVENISGLFVFFDILATEVAGQNLTPSLTANFQNIDPGEIAVGRWLFRSSLQGHFVEYAASFEHLDGLGDPRLSLIDSVEIHELNHIVRDVRPGADTFPDFLVNDETNDTRHLPDRIHLSNGRVEPVSVVTTVAVTGVLSGGNLQVTLTAPMPAGWACLHIADPGQGSYRLVRVRCPDGTELPVENFWQTDRTFADFQRPVREEILHLLDFDSTGSYTLTYATIVDVTPPASMVSTLPANSFEQVPLQWIGQDETGGSGIAFYDIFVSANGGPFTNWLLHTTLTAAIFPGQPGGHYLFYSVATDHEGNRESDPGTPDAMTTVNLTNTAPVPGALPSVVTINEGDEFVLQVTATDDQAPPQRLRFSVLNAPFVIDPVTGLIRWQTTELNGPGTNVFTVMVADNGLPPLSAGAQVTLIVREVNRGPMLAGISDQLVNEGRRLCLTNFAADTDFPANTLRYSLCGAAPAGLTLDGITGVLCWQPTSLQGPSTNCVCVEVSDNGVPSLSATQRFCIIVRDVQPDFTLSLGLTNLFAGETNQVLLRLNSGLELTEVHFDLAAAGDRLTNFTLASVSPEVTGLLLEPASGGRSHVTIGLNPALLQPGARSLANLGFTAILRPDSAIVPLRVENLGAARASGGAVGHVASVDGRVIVVATEPVLEVARAPGSNVNLTLYGHPGARYQMETNSSLSSPNGWLPSSSVTPLSQREIIGPLPWTGDAQFFRVKQE